MVRRADILGFGIGFGLGLGDYLLLRLAEVAMFYDGRDVTLAVVVLFALNFGALGAVIGRLATQRSELRAQADQIERQYRELRDARGRADEAERLAAVGRMAAGVAHEVRNPLSVIRSSAQLIGEGAADGAAGEAARFIREEVDRLDDFVSRVLGFSGGMHASPAPVTWGELVGRARALSGVDGRSLQFVGDADIALNVDPDLMEKLIVALVDNAVQAGGPTADVQVELAVDERGAWVSVADDGPGVPEELHTTMFEPFFTTKASGTGLGLSMVEKYAAAHHGGAAVEYRADSGLGEGRSGACFVVGPFELADEVAS